MNITNSKNAHITKKCLFYLLILICILTLLFYNLDLLNLNLNETSYNEISGYLLKSRCDCRKEVIEVHRVLAAATNGDDANNQEAEMYDIHVKNSHNTNETIKRYQIGKTEFEKMTATCDWYSTLRRGLGQKIIGFSLFGREELYYNYLDHNVIRTAALLPDWVIRVYHDGSIDKSIICEKICLENKKSSSSSSSKEGEEKSTTYYDNIEFCDVEKLPNGLHRTWNAGYMIPMSWRWLPIGDDFVDVFISRDTDSCVNTRETAALKEWLDSNNLFHIMRDHPAHRVLILGGMWGFYNKKSKTLAKYFYEVITSRFKAFYYRSYMSKRNPDQYMLREYFWPIAKLNATMHDSFYCSSLGGKPFPTRREADCHVGYIGCCNEKSNVTFGADCPIECRPAQHATEWTTC